MRGLWPCQIPPVLLSLYQASVSLTRLGFPNHLQNDLRWQTEDRLPWGLPLRCGRTFRARTSSAGDAGKGRRTGAPAACDRSGARRRRAGRGGEDRRHGSADPAGLGDPVQRSGAGRPDQQIVAGRAGQAEQRTESFLARLVEDGPIPAVHGVVRWRACDLIMRIHEEFGISVSDDTIYRSLKDLGFSHVSARPRA